LIVLGFWVLEGLLEQTNPGFATHQKSETKRNRSIFIQWQIFSITRPEPSTALREKIQFPDLLGRVLRWRHQLPGHRGILSTRTFYSTL